MKVTDQRVSVQMLSAVSALRELQFHAVARRAQLDLQSLRVALAEDRRRSRIADIRNLYDDEVHWVPWVAGQPDRRSSTSPTHPRALF